MKRAVDIKKSKPPELPTHEREKDTIGDTSNLEKRRTITRNSGKMRIRKRFESRCRYIVDVISKM